MEMKTASSECNDPEKIIERILLLETSGVGCGPICSCRAQLAITMSDKQEQKVREHATRVTFDKVPTDAAIVKQLLDGTLVDIQPKLLDKLHHDRAGRSIDKIKGGPEQALMSLFALIEMFAETAPVAFGIADSSGATNRRI